MVALFPGHFGAAPGAVDDSKNDGNHTVEAAITAMVAAQLRVELKYQYNVLATLFTGTLEERVNDANDAGCSLGLSIHCDSMPTLPGVRGMHTIIYPGSTAGLSYAVAIINKWHDQVKQIPIRQFTPEPRSDLYVLRKTRFPVVLVELGFLTNVDDEAALQLDATRDSIVAALAGATFRAIDMVIRE